MGEPPGGGPPAAPGGGAPDWGQMKGKLTSARGPDQLLLISSLVFVVCTFLPWYRVKVGALSASDNAWSMGALGFLAALLGLATFVLAMLLVIGTVKPSPSTAMATLGLAGVTLFFTLLRLLFEPGDDAEALSGGILKVTRGIGLWIGIVAAVVMAVAAYQKFSAKHAAA